MKNKILMGLAAIAMVAVLASCAKKPQVEIDATNAAIAAAQAAEANVYLPTEFAALQDSMNVINTAIAAKEGKMFKNFKPEIAKLESLKTQAVNVTNNVTAKKDEVKKEAETILNDIKAVVAENAKLVTKLPRGKEGAAIIEQIKADLGNVDTAVAEAQASFDKGTYMDALNKIKAAKVKADGLNSEIKETLTKAKIRF
jgi:predicted  nucleic acid-binding Zn-ribbon protein